MKTITERCLEMNNRLEQYKKDKRAKEYNYDFEYLDKKRKAKLIYSSLTEKTKRSQEILSSVIK